MYDIEEHLDNLVRHIDLARSACILLGKRLIVKEDRKEFGRHLIARGFVHDASKFNGIEWDCLHVGPDIEPEKLELAISQHVRTNSHHPEYHGGVHKMAELDVAEMVCDWYARSQEFGTGLRDWIEKEAVEKYQIDKESKHYEWICHFVDMLLENSFSSDKKE